MNAFSTWKAERLGCFFLLALSLSVRFSGKRQKVCFMLRQWSSDEDCVAADNSLVSISFRSFCIGFASFFFISFACFLSSNRGFETLLPSFVFCTVCALYAKQNYENVHQTQKTRIKKQSLYFGATAIGDCDGEKFKTKRNHCGKSPTEKAFKSTKMQENSAKESVRTSESAWK